MFAKSKITLLVLAVGLSSLLSGNSIGSASAYPQPDELSLKQDLGDANDLKLLEDFFKRKAENSNGAQTILYQNAIQGNAKDENHLVLEIDQRNILVEGKIPNGMNSFGAVTVRSYNVIQPSDSGTKNYLGSRLTQENITYNFKE